MPLEDFSNRPGHRLVTAKVWGKKDSFGAHTLRRGCWHCRAYSEPPCLVRCGTDHRTLALPSHDDRATFERRTITLLDRRIEGVHIHMNDLASTYHGNS